MEAPRLKLLTDIRAASFAMRCAAISGNSAETAHFSILLDDLTTKAKRRQIGINYIGAMSLDGALRAAMECRRDDLAKIYQAELNKLDFDLNPEL